MYWNIWASNNNRRKETKSHWASRVSTNNDCEWNAYAIGFVLSFSFFVCFNRIIWFYLYIFEEKKEPINCQNNELKITLLHTILLALSQTHTETFAFLFLTFVPSLCYVCYIDGLHKATKQEKKYVQIIIFKLMQINDRYSNSNTLYFCEL